MKISRRCIPALFSKSNRGYNSNRIGYYAKRPFQRWRAAAATYNASMTNFHLWILALLFAELAGCQDRNQRPESSSTNPPSTTAPTPPASDVTDQWLGKWIGPEGTYLVVSKNGGRYVVEIHSLDGTATYDGSSAGNRIEFQRNGKTESIRAGNGEETGMKWLLDKKNCLIIKTGEGFCRD